MMRHFFWACVLVGCTPTAKPSEPPDGGATSAAAAPEPVADDAATKPEAAAVATYAVTLTNLGSDACEYAIGKRGEKPADDAPTTSMPPGKTSLEMGADQSLWLKTPEAKFGSGGATDRSGGEIVIHADCRAIAVSDSIFDAKQHATMMPHVAEVCCRACPSNAECSECAPPTKAGKCKPKGEVAGRCATYEDATHCVAATDVDAHDNVRALTSPPRAK